LIKFSQRSFPIMKLNDMPMSECVCVCVCVFVCVCVCVCLRVCVCVCLGLICKRQSLHRRARGQAGGKREREAREGGRKANRERERENTQYTLILKIQKRALNFWNHIKTSDPLSFSYKALCCQELNPQRSPLCLLVLRLGEP